MKKIFNIVGRSSWLSMAQIALFSQRVKAVFPDVELNVIIEETKGDKIQSTPLHKIEGKDFFTKEIQDKLRSGEADFAIHSMKDVSGDVFFEQSHYVIFDRNDPRDVAIFNPDIIEKIKRQEKIIIGTSSPRRAAMASTFLTKALPNDTTQKVQIKAVPIRGNVNARLGKLENEPYDGIILAAAGLNRLLEYEPSQVSIKRLLQNKKLMVLPMFECPPAAGQGAIVAETNKDNIDAIKILQLIENQQLTNAVKAERNIAEKHGFGCSQAFGTFHLDLEHTSFTYSAGQNKAQEKFVEWDFEVQNKAIDIGKINWLNTADYMKDFFDYRYEKEDSFLKNKKKGIFIASHKVVFSTSIVEKIAQHRVWAAGTRSWFELAKKGIWVEGCADGLGLENIVSTLESPLIDLKKEEWNILTNTESSKNWQDKGWYSEGAYTLIPKNKATVLEAIQAAEAIFWTSYQQYKAYKYLITKPIVHGCPSGNTANRLRAEGLNVLIFPTIKAFK
jgi:hydroxymethylbilane synthase